ncbi:O-antigen ligase family protein [Candidatus Peregrinibacteria bacterium]|nr:O-antigen ligase family protein [Candidatus Peregrinibacteria bacterium]
MNFNKILLWVNLFFLQSYLVRFSIGPVPTNLQEVLIGLNVVAFGWMLLKEKRFLRTVKDIPKHWVLLGFVVLTVLSFVIVRPPVNVDFIRAVRFLLFAVLLTFMFVQTFRTDMERRHALFVAGMGAIFFGIFSAIYNLAGQNVAYDYRLQGPLDSAVYLSYYLTPFFLFFVIDFFQNMEKRANIFHAILLGILILFTRSMGSIVVSVLLLCLYFFKRSDLRFLRSKAVKTGLGIVLALVLGMAFYVKILPSFTTTNTSLGERDEIWATSMYLLKDPKNLMFGVGYGQFQTQYAANVDAVLGHKPLDYIILQPHNIFLLFVFQYGLLGVAFLLFCMYKAAQQFLHAGKKDELRVIVGIMLFYFFLHGLIDTPFFKNDLLILLVLLMELGTGNLLIKQGKKA